MPVLYISIPSSGSTNSDFLKHVFFFTEIGHSQNASVFNAIALAVQNSSDVVEIRLSQRHLVEILVNGQQHELDTSTSELKGQ